MKKLVRLLAVFLIVLALPLNAAAEVVQPSEDFWYLDEANVLSEATEGEIFFANQRLYDACGAEIVVVTVDTTGRLSTEDYAYKLFNEWEIGGNTYLGFLLLMAIDDDDYYAMTGTKMEGYIDSGSVGEMLDRYLEPDFANRNYDAGAKLFFENVYAEVADQLNLNLKIEDAVRDYQSYVSGQSASAAKESERTVPEEPYERETRIYMGPSFGQIILIVLILALIFGGTRRRRRGTSFMFFPGFFHPHPRGPRPRPFAPRPPHPEPRRPFDPGRPPVGGMRSSGPRPGGSRPSSFSGGFGGASRSGGSSRPSGGFGGASRSGGASRGPSTRGGGAGRGGRR